MKLLRSLLFVPSAKQELFSKALACAPDAIIFDLEDSIGSASGKQLGRENIVKFMFDNPPDNRPSIFVRINDLESSFLLQDLECVFTSNSDGVMFPKVNSAADIHFASRLLKSFEIIHSREEEIPIIPLIESAEAVMNCYEIAKSSSRIIGLAFGGEDYLASTLGTTERDERAFDLPRATILNSARAVGVASIDTVQPRVKEDNRLKTVVASSADFGFDGMMCLTPRQVKIANSGYSLSKKQMSEINEIISKSKLEDGGKGFTISISERLGFIGPPMIRAAINRKRKRNIDEGEA